MGAIYNSDAQQAASRFFAFPPSQKIYNPNGAATNEPASVTRFDEI